MLGEEVREDQLSVSQEVGRGRAGPASTVASASYKACFSFLFSLFWGGGCLFYLI